MADSLKILADTPTHVDIRVPKLLIEEQSESGKSTFVSKAIMPRDQVLSTTKGPKVVRGGINLYVVTAPAKGAKDAG